MKTRFSIFLIAVLSVVSLFSCSSDDDGVDKDSIESNLPAEAKVFVGYWENQTSKGYSYYFFEDGYCWTKARNYEGHYGSTGYWTFDPATKILATTTEGNWQWQVTLSNSEAWAGVSLGSNTTQTFKKEDNKYDFVYDLLLYSTWEESADSTLTFMNRGNLGFNLDGTINTGGAKVIIISEDDNTNDYTVTYKIGQLYYNSRRDSYYLGGNIGSGTIEVLNPTKLSKNQIRITGYLNKTLKRKMD